ncbi:putative Bax inhibitor 1 [Hypsibius exemplaris]|uniref:Bax inhibitor 1 n=1 Tax=Hypsibius exemplaris TaxID=2072580 RepID=A0A1W0WU46_HYPEX|nr:putative Bax inhibitor 1 [Hypsibius exemplaris]
MDFMRHRTDSERSGFDLQGLLDFSALEKPVKQHLTKVYGALAMASTICAAGAYCAIQGLVPAIFTGFLSLIAVLGLTIWLISTEPSPQNQDKRMGMFMGVAALMGINMAGLIEMVIAINPQIVFTALMVTTVVFTCFSLAALLSGNQRQFLYLGGILSSGLMSLMVIRLIGMLTGSKIAMDLTMYLGLAILCGFVLFDTQMIVMKCRAGDRDYIKHALDLFIDAVGLFKHIMVLLAQKEDRRNNKRRN